MLDLKINSLFPATRVLVWRLEETPHQLLALCHEAGIPCDDLLEKPVKRQREKAAERLLLCRAFGRPVTLSHTEQGAPFVDDHDVNISITHTMELVAVALNDRYAIGLDAERVDRRQMLRVRDKFLNDSEKEFIAPEDLAAHVIAWTAKEAVIKVERNSAIDWTWGICLEPFNADGDETVFGAHCGERRYRLMSRLVDGHRMTLAVPAAEQTDGKRQ